MNSNDDEKSAELLRIEKIIAAGIVDRVKMARLGQPYSLVAPKPHHFPMFSKCDRLMVSEGIAVHDPQLELLYSYGMPRGYRQILITFPGITHSEEFKDFTIEMFGLKGKPSEQIERLKQRQVGQVKYANVDPATLPMNAGLCFTVSNPDNKDDQHTVYAWRWRVYMDDSSLCLENLWHDLSGWIPFVLGIKYDNPEKMVADVIRFAPAFRLCNLVEAKLLKIGGDTRPKEIQELWSDENCKRFALLVKELAPKWYWIKSNDYDPGFSTPENWVSEVRDRSEFPALFGNYEKLTDDLLLRVTNCNLSSADREPVTLACAHAARELGFTEIYQKHKGSEPAASTLRGYYEKGLRLLKN